MNASETRAAAQVMLDSLEPGAEVEVEFRDKASTGWKRCIGHPYWDWSQCQYRVKPKPRRFWIAVLEVNDRIPARYVLDSKEEADKFLRTWKHASDAVATITEVEEVKEEKR